MNIDISNFNKQVLITFKEGDFIVTLSTLGASFVQIQHKSEELIYTPIDKSDMLKPDYYYGKTIGPICNRIANGEVYVGNKLYLMSLNEKQNTLHSGTNGISHKYFSYDIDNNESSVTFKYYKKAYEDGLPGNVLYTIKYVVKYMEIQLFYDVTSDEDTVIAITNHVYFCLKDRDVTKFYFQGEFDKYVVPGISDLLPNKIDNIPYYLNFDEPTCLGENLYNDELQSQRTKGFDFDLIFKNESEKHIVFLNDSAYELSVETDYNSVQIYTDNYENPYKFKDVALSKYGAISIEPCDILLNRPLLKKNDHYLRYIKYCIKEK